MPALPRLATALSVTAITAGLSFGVTPATASTVDDRAAQKVVSTTTTADVNVPLVSRGEAATRPIVNRAVAGPTRLAGANRYETSVQISRRAYTPDTAKTVYLVGGNRLDEALAGAALTDGPVLLVPTTGPVPASVTAEIGRLKPSQVVALGGTTSVSAATLTQAAQGRSTLRIGSNDVYATTAAIARRAFPQGASTVYLARVGASPDAIVGGALKDGPVIPVPATGAAPSAIRSVVTALAPKKVNALGGPAAISATTLTSAASGTSTGRIAGATRYETSQAVAKVAFPRGAAVAYLASGTSFADAVVGGMLGDGPILLTPPASAAALSASVANVLTGLGVRTIGTLGGSAVVPDAAIGAVAAKVPTATTTGTLPRYTTSPTPTAAPAPTPTVTATPPTPAPTVTAPAPTPTTSTPPPTPTPTWTPPPTVKTPTPTATTTSAPVASVTTAAESCDTLVQTFKPVPMDSRYSIVCVSSLDSSRTLGVTETWLTYGGEFVKGTVKIRSDLDQDLMKAVIAHELSHAWSYAYMTNATRQSFAAYLKAPSWDGDDNTYDSMPAEVWARSQATCSGYPDGFRRKEVTCDELRPFGWG